MEIIEEIKFLDIPIISEKKYSSIHHKIFQKYSSPIYQKYSFKLLENLCQRFSFDEKAKIFHKSMHFLLKFLYLSKNDILIPNLDLIIITSFYFGIITTINQNKVPSICRLKNIYIEKFGNFRNEEIKYAQIVFLKLLDYNIHFMTAFDYLNYRLKSKFHLVDIPKVELERLIKENPKEYCIRTPISLSQELIEKIHKIEIAIPSQTIIEKKIIKNRTSFLADESPSTANSSGQFNNIILKYDKSPIRNINRRNIDIVLSRSNDEKNLFYTMNCKDKKNQIYINKNYKKINTYTKKNVQNFKKTNNNQNKENYRNNKSIIYKNHIKKGIKDIIILNDINDKINGSNLNIKSPTKIYHKPTYIKKEGKNYFSSIKKKGKDITIKFIKNNEIKNDKIELYKPSLVRRLNFEER